MEFWHIGLAALVVLAIGFASVVVDLRRLSQRLEYAHSFRDRFLAYGDSKGQDREAYAWLTRNAHRMQGEMGGIGILGAFKPPFANYQYRDYAIVLNFLPAIRELFEDGAHSGGGLQARELGRYGMMLDEALLRHVGVLDHAFEQAWARLLNPFTWFRDGIRHVLAVPIYLLQLFGVLSAHTVGRITSARLFKALAAFAGLVGFVSAAAGFFVDWPEIKEVLTPYLPGFLEFGGQP